MHKNMLVGGLPVHFCTASNVNVISEHELDELRSNATVHLVGDDVLSVSVWHAASVIVRLEIKVIPVSPQVLLMTF
jgi:hypothetical protein